MDKIQSQNPELFDVIVKDPSFAAHTEEKNNIQETARARS